MKKTRCKHIYLLDVVQVETCLNLSRCTDVVQIPRLQYVLSVHRITLWTNEVVKIIAANGLMMETSNTKCVTQLAKVFITDDSVTITAVY